MNLMEEEAKDYITLYEAAKLCSYSEPYLRLRARQGKLKSIKLGSRWVTKASWIKEYEARVQEWNDKIAAKAILTSSEKQNFIPASQVSVNAPEAVPAAPAPTVVFQQAKAPEPRVVQVCTPSAPEIVLPPPSPRYKDRQGLEFAVAVASGVVFAALLFFGAANDARLRFDATRAVGIGQANISDIAIGSAQDAAGRNDFPLQADGVPPRQSIGEFFLSIAPEGLLAQSDGAVWAWNRFLEDLKSMAASFSLPWR